MSELTSVELFAGIGGFRLAADENGVKTIWANDINDLAAKVYRDRFHEGTFVEGDINTLLDVIPNHDILTGGFPCQPFSKAGKKQGVDDYRGTLFESIVTILSMKNPKYFILENVNSLLYLDNGRNFRTILSALSELGYKIEWRVLNAVSFGLPQHRERVIIIGSHDLDVNDSYLIDEEDEDEINDSLTNGIPSYSLWKRIVDSKGKFGTWGMAFGDKFITCDIKERQYSPSRKLSDILEEDVDSSFDFTADTIERIKNSQYVNKFYNGVQILYNQAGGARMGYSIFGTEGTAPTLTASTSRHYERYAVGNKYRRLTNVEYARLQGFSDDHCQAVTAYNQYKLYGNAVPHQLVSFVMKRVINKQYRTLSQQQLSIFDLGRD